MRQLKSSDGIVLEISGDGLRMSRVLENMSEDITETVFPVPVRSDILTMIIDFCEFFSRSRTKSEIEKFETAFYTGDVKTLLDVLNIADFLDISKLVTDLCERIASMIRGKTADQIREIFGTEKLTKDEERELRSAHSWAFED